MSSETAMPWGGYRRILAYALRHRARAAIGVLAAVVMGLSQVGFLRTMPYVLMPPDQVSQELSGGTGADGAAATGDDWLRRAGAAAARLGVTPLDAHGAMTWQFFALLIGVAPIFVAVRAVGVFFNRYYMTWIGAKVSRDLRDDLMGSLQRQSLGYFGRCDVGRLISNCTNDLNAIEQVLSSTMADTVRAPIEIVAAGVFAFWYAAHHGIMGFMLILVLAFPLCILPIVVLGRYVRRYMRRALERISDVVSRMHETLTCIRVVKAFHAEAREQGRFVEVNAGYFRNYVSAVKAELMMTPLMEAVAIILSIVFLLVCYAHGVTLYQLLPLGVAAVMVYRPVKQLSRINANLQRGTAALERVYALLDADTALPEPATPRRVAGFESEIRFEDVSFRYDGGGGDILNGVSLCIPRGSVVAVVGETGSGKSTLANLLARFYDPTAGRVLLDGHDLREIAVADLRRIFGIVNQETVLFNDTIANNIAYGCPGIARTEIEAAARLANADAFIAAHPDGYDRVVGEKGFVLSGGEKQRIAIARAVLLNPPILILDEATSSLDTVTERLVQEAIARAMAHRTVFAIAHRLSTVKHADEILVIEKGVVVERGTHETLYAAGGRYRRLCDIQFGEGPVRGEEVA